MLPKKGIKIQTYKNDIEWYSNVLKKGRYAYADAYAIADAHIHARLI